MLCTPLLAGCSSGSAQTAGDVAQAGYVAGDGSTVVVPESQRVKAPVLSGTTLDGAPWSSEAALGHVLVINVWASWCAPCRAEAPTLQQGYVKYQADGVQFVGLNTRDSDAAAKAFVARYAITYPNVIDTDGQIQLRFRDNLPPQSIPSTLFLDKQGRVAARVLGEIERARLDGIIETLQAEPA